MMDDAELNTYSGLLDMCVRGLAVLWLALSVYIFLFVIAYREYFVSEQIERNQYTSSFLIMTEFISFPSSFISKKILQHCDYAGR